MTATLAYLKRRLDERATWLMIGAGITAGAALAWPWSLISVIAATIGALVPDGTATK
jgi:fumarate reductase subunit D